MTENTYNNDCCKWTMEEREKILATGTLEQKKEAFKDDEELMRETTKFVSEVIQMAITEASKRIMFTENYSPGHRTDIASRDHNRLLRLPELPYFAEQLLTQLIE
ncbi:hypothetical protein K0M31_009970 [Melipona bicolor]|uniref:Uncharacterized protein n=1 Tax=Melipona bicolor TaxID=60889 RepID=A0AA40FM20_9HYME|nr:hypothetical protein K0M31_009970 [Melipona bicolor]